MPFTPILYQQRRIGKESERKLHSAIDGWSEKRKSAANILFVEKGSFEDDHDGIDFWVHTTNGIIPLQVKSSERRATNFSLVHPKIPVIVIGLTDRIDTVREKITKLNLSEKAKTNVILPR